MWEQHKAGRGGVRRSEFSFSKLVCVVLDKSKGLDPLLRLDPFVECKHFDVLEAWHR